jgi:hypothetical protein
VTEPEIPASTRIADGVELAPSRLGGSGLFATRPIAAGEVVLVWGGPSYTDAEGYRRARAAGRGGMRWDDDVYSVETHPVEDAFRINHSCDPNVWMEGAFTLTARRDVAVGEELLVDYAIMLDDEAWSSPWRCRCGSPLCRGRVTGDDWKLASLREAYRGHFTPLLEKRIAGD